MPRVVHFEIHAADPARAVKFYGDLFGWKATKWDGPMEYWLVDTGEGNGINGAIVSRQGDAPTAGAPVNAYVCTVGVDSIDDTIAAIAKAGGRIVVEKMEIPAVGWLCYAHDPEGNIFGVMQPM